MHSGVVILAWMVGVVGLQFVPLVYLAGIVGGIGLVAAWRARERSFRLLRRIRVLIVAIAILFGGFTPGEALWVDLGVLSPSREGVTLAFEHGARVVGIVLCVALLLEGLGLERLVGGLHALLRPLTFCGFPADRLAIRLMLVLRYVEVMPPGAWRHCLEERSPEGFDDEGAIAVRLRREQLGWVELAVLACVLLSVVLVLRIGGLA